MGASRLDASVSVDGVNLVVKHPNLKKFRPFNHGYHHFREQSVISPSLILSQALYLDLHQS